MIAKGIRYQNFIDNIAAIRSDEIVQDQKL